jgi:hypothetical protein
MSGDGGDVSLNSSFLISYWPNGLQNHFVNKIGKDIAMGGVVTEEQAISRA